MKIMTNLSEKSRIGGSLIHYYMICKRQIWFSSRGIYPDSENEFLISGRINSEISHKKEKHEITFGNNKFDIVKKHDDSIIIIEVKKSSKLIESSRLQILHYLYELKKEGITAEGELSFPTERKKEKIILKEEDIKKLDDIYDEIYAITELELPPMSIKTKYCKPCGHAEFCWS